MLSNNRVKTIDSTQNTNDALGAIKFPDIRFPFDVYPQRSDAHLIKGHVLAWAQKFGLIGRRGAQRLQNTPLLELGFALCGSAPTEHAQLIVCWYLWALVLDDRIDDGPWAENGALESFLAEVEAVIETTAAHGCSTHHRQLDDPMLVVLAEDLWPQTRQWGNERWQHQCAHHFIQHLQAQAVLVKRRETNTSLTPAQYLPLRRNSFGALFFFDLMDAAETLDPYDTAKDVNQWNALREHCADILAWTNDIYSVAKDVLCGERFNLVTILADDMKINLSDAFDSAHHLVKTTLAQFNAIAASLPVVIPPSQATNPDRLRRLMRSVGDWHRTVSRYHVPASVKASYEEQNVNMKLKPPTLKSRQFELDPYPLYEQLRTTMPIVYDEPMDVWLVSRYVDVKTVLTHPNVNSNNYSWQIGPLLGHTIVSMDGGEHAQHRALLSPAFRGKALKILEESVVSITTALLARMHGRDDVDLVSDFAEELPIRVMARARVSPRKPHRKSRSLNSGVP